MKEIIDQPLLASRASGWRAVESVLCRRLEGSQMVHTAFIRNRSTNFIPAFLSDFSAFYLAAVEEDR